MPGGAYLEETAGHIGLAFAGYLPVPIAVDPGGLQARRQTLELLVEPIDSNGAPIPVQHSPQAYWNQGSPYPGPPATVQYSHDYDSQRFWGRMGQGILCWSEHQPEISGDLPGAIPQDMAQHLDVFQRFMGGFANIARNRPSSFGDQVATLDPKYGWSGA